MKILVLLEERTTNIPLLHASASALHQHDMCKHYRTLAVATALIERSTPAFIRPTADLPLAYDRRSDLSLLILLIKMGGLGAAAPQALMGYVAAWAVIFLVSMSCTYHMLRYVVSARQFSEIAYWACGSAFPYAKTDVLLRYSLPSYASKK